VGTRTEPCQDYQFGARIVGQAPALVRAIEKLPAIANSGAPVFIFGESGTGKELVARAIHYLSDRAPFAFVAINCGSFPETLLESEFFGYERGAFTNAHTGRDGLIAQADGGTLFLDEIDHLPAKAQVDLLRVLQDRKFRALGSTAERESNVRFVAATNSSIEPLMEMGGFRMDLFYRLCVFMIHLPPLRDRWEDVLPLAEHFLRKHSPSNRPRPALTREASDALLAYHWPGNIRELENAIIRGIFLCQKGEIAVEDLGLGLRTPAAAKPPSPGSFKAAKQHALAAFERSYLDRLMAEHRGNVTNAARAAGKDRRDLGKLLKKHRVDPKHFYISRERTA
jgi:DNA-binding NtrC family response regulator